MARRLILQALGLALFAFLLVIVWRELSLTPSYNYDKFAAGQYHFGEFNGPEIGQPMLDFELVDSRGPIWFT